ncbi:hypothetical protein F8M41_025387 [Gigaspora margarita]|uniref:Ion transport domain-containing protein n=1 Tax=Gigaspora margarita TaxID=4874 RepID=A0A8H3XJE9_GIGMA|nr:hypothetical protein F8M41_025387 [Gigaspora margarita]
MSSSKSEEPLSGDQDQPEILIHSNSHGENNDVPHDGKKIDKYVLSPNMECIATLSKEDKSIFVWTITKTITKELIVKYDSSLDVNVLECALNTDKLCKKPDFNFEDLFFPGRLIGISDCKHVIIKLDSLDFEIDFAIIDITTKLRQRLVAQGLEDRIEKFSVLDVVRGAESISFLENGDLAILKEKPVYRVYIFSKSNPNGKHKWTCKKSIELEKFDLDPYTNSRSNYDNDYDFDFDSYDSYTISKKGKLFMCFRIPWVIMQWDLITRKFDMQYILNWKLFSQKELGYPSINTIKLLIELNSDNTMLAVADSGYGKYWVYVYLTKSGVMVVNTNVDAKHLYDFHFIGSGEEERLFFSSENSYVLNPYTLSLDKFHDNHAIYNMISDYIIKIDDKNHLSIQRLSQNEIWKNYLEREERCHSNAYIYPYFNIKEIMPFVQNILDRYESVQNLTENYLNTPSNMSEECRRGPCTWIINYEVGISGMCHIKLKAKTGSSKEIDICRLSGNICEYKVLENGDMLLVFPSDVLIYTIKKHSDENFRGELIYWWSKNRYEVGKAENSKDFIISFLTLFIKNFNLDSYNFGFDILPTPTLTLCAFDPMHEESLSLFQSDFNSSTLLKLYGHATCYQLIEGKASDKAKRIDKLLGNCYNHSLSMLESGDICSFILITGQIAFTLIKLEEYNKNRRFIEEFLSKTNILIGHIDPYYYHRNNDSLLFNLQHCRAYVNSHSLSNTSFFNYLFFWISKKYNFLKKSYPKVYQILTFPYLHYSSYITIYPQETVILMFPLSGFATYPKKYSYNELFYLQGNPFTSLLNTTNYYKWWSIKALINFKWNTYGRFYYFIIWAIYSTFMCCFLIVSTIPEHKLSWSNQRIFLVATIFFGFIHFIFEVRQFIHKPPAYIASPWNWFGDSSYVSSWSLKNNWTLAFLLVIFSFFTTIYLLNLFISLLGNAIDDRNNKESFLQLREEILTEIELFWMLPHQRRKKNWFPEILYYKASVNELKKYVESFENKESFHPKILEITGIKTSEEKLKNQINEVFNNESFKSQISEVFKNESFKNQVNDVLKNQIDETLTSKINEALKKQVDETLKDPLDKINKLIELIEKKESE